MFRKATLGVHRLGTLSGSLDNPQYPSTMGPHELRSYEDVFAVDGIRHPTGMCRCEGQRPVQGVRDGRDGHPRMRSYVNSVVCTTTQQCPVATSLVVLPLAGRWKLNTSRGQTKIDIPIESWRSAMADHRVKDKFHAWFRPPRNPLSAIHGLP